MKALVLVLAVALAAAPVGANPYPTTVTVDYVLGCMAANGQTHDAMRRCSCSIDAVASLVPYDVYERAEVVMRVQGVSGGSMTLFRDTQALKDIVDQLRAAQVEADFRCF